MEGAEYAVSTSPQITQTKMCFCLFMCCKSSMWLCEGDLMGFHLMTDEDGGRG